MSEKLWFSFHTSYTSVLVASYWQQKSIICLIALRYLRMYNVFGQHHPAPVTPATKATPHTAYSGRVPSRMPRACLLHSHQAVQRGPRWTMGGDAVTTNEITKLTQCNV